MTKKNKDKKSWLNKGAAIGAALLSKKDLIVGVFDKLYTKEGKSFDFSKISNRFMLFGRMMKAYFKGEYKDVSPMLFISTVAGVLYLVADVDLIPDSIPIAGAIDDISVIVWVLNVYGEEIKKYDLWEAQNVVKDISLV